ncbi:hypothetical protein AMS68_000502 [Peltaster fructicola]|uniref:Large ribosomal subunit protein uL4m n=1 Tax=Peltaster fructicola TaxID=286661 RepID=A0A6H0XK39_9PEZI|nr:hypothetical protein AMS68_000502 [Peltaster fructicola]
MATETTPPTPVSLDTSSSTTTPSQATATTRPSNLIHPLQHQPPANPFLTAAQCTLHSFPQLVPAGYAIYPSTHLMLPLRKDLLHLAVTFEADATRQGTASTKWRSEVHGSGRKVRPQKGSGRARLGDKKSPVIKGGGVAFGPKPRDFSTELPEKMYDLAWRTALSYRYRRGQLTVLQGHANIEEIHRDSRARYLKDMLLWHKMGHSNGRTLIVTMQERPALFEAFEDRDLLWHAELLKASDVDVKDLLELGRIMIEQEALDHILLAHQTDLSKERKLASARAALNARRSVTFKTPSVFS